MTVWYERRWLLSPDCAVTISFMKRFRVFKATVLVLSPTTLLFWFELPIMHPSPLDPPCLVNARVFQTSHLSLWCRFSVKIVRLQAQTESWETLMTSLGLLFFRLLYIIGLRFCPFMSVLYLTHSSICSSSTFSQLTYRWETKPLPSFL